MCTTMEHLCKMGREGWGLVLESLTLKMTNNTNGNTIRSVRAKPVSKMRTLSARRPRGDKEATEVELALSKKLAQKSWTRRPSNI